jgi:hypothetical protein
MLCDSCGYENEWSTLSCANCGVDVQTPEQAVERMAMWESMPQAMQDEVVRKRKEEQERYQDYAAFSKAMHARSIVAGAVIGLVGGLFQAGAALGAALGTYLVCLLVNGALSALAGHLLFRRQGDVFSGVVHFSMAFIAASIVESGLGLAFWRGAGLLFFFGVSAAMGGGAVLGSYLAKQEFRRRIPPGGGGNPTNDKPAP